MKFRLFLSFLLSFTLVLSSFLSLSSPCPKAQAQTNENTSSQIEINANAAVLLEESTGTILYEKNKDKELVPASITKIMTLLLIFDEIEEGHLNLSDTVTVSEYAAGMGGSQVFLEAQETQTVETMIKCICIASANDAAVAMAEKIAGSEETFVKKMNEKALSLGMKHTQFKNCTGLDDNIENGHFSSAYDVAVMSRELIAKHPEISNYSTVWMDSITHKTKKGEKEFGLTNTNKLVRFYDGITGLKTGSTSKAKYCLSATAKRNGISLIAVVMAAPDHKMRFQEAQKLLDYGFANCFVYEDNYKEINFSEIDVQGGIPEKISVYPRNSFSHIFTHSYDSSKIRKECVYKELHAPVEAGTNAGTLVYYYEGKEIGNVPLLARQSAKKAGYADFFSLLLKQFLTP